MESRGHSSKQPGSSSLELLQSIVDVGLQPENFADVCKAWAEHSEEAEALKSFESLLNTVYFQNSKYFETRDLKRSLVSSPDDGDVESHSFIINRELDIIYAGEYAAKLLNIHLNQKANTLFDLDPNIIFESVEAADMKVSFGDVIGANATRHLASVIKLSEIDNTHKHYKFTLWKIELPSESEDYIRRTLNLTNTELDILKLCLQRYSVHAIADIRGSSLNTIRTHVKNIKNKFRSHSLTDVISSTHEIIALHHTAQSGSTHFKNDYIPRQRNVGLVKLPASPYQVEYSRYGNPEDKPLVILHSIEYGISPPKAFLELAHEKGFCVYVPVRPGFGRTTPADSIPQAAQILNRFFKSITLKDITLVSLSTSAPTSLELLHLSSEIRDAIFVNYAFDTKNKIPHIQPVWLRGLLEFGLGSPESFKFAFRMSKGMLKVIGYNTFYKKMYQSCEEDLLYLATNAKTFEASANLILSAEPDTCRNDIAASFLENPHADWQATSGQNIRSLFGEYTHGISLAPIKSKAKELGIPFNIIEGTGRNCIYQKPEVFFDLIKSRVNASVTQ